MTAEIVLMNQEAIAIAADSAVTLREEKGQKIFTSANKLFTLSKYHPVGIMIYGSGKFMNVPLETIIKTYRINLGDIEYDSLENYANDFLRYLCDSNFFPEPLQDDFFENFVLISFKLISAEIKKEVNTIIENKKTISLHNIKLILTTIIKEHHGSWKEAQFSSGFTNKHIGIFKRKYYDVIEKGKKEFFESLPLSKANNRKLTEIAILFFLKSSLYSMLRDVSGVVITDFGKKDIFPKLKSYLLVGIANNYLKYQDHIDSEISYHKEASIIPFAQSEMVSTFMEGVDPDFDKAIKDDLKEIFDSYSSTIIDSIDKLSAKENDKHKLTLRSMNEEFLEKYKEKVDNYKREKYVDPIINVVAGLPKADLASMAESLVHLTLFKRRVSMEEESVGGPIDVAVISKGDGFIWIKRKHYFSAEMNYHFFKNYYKESENERNK